MAVKFFPIRIVDTENKNVYILRNKVQDVVKKYHLPATFKNEQMLIENCSYDALEQLKAMGIKISKIK